MSLEQRIKALKEKTFYDTLAIDVVEHSDDFLVIKGYVNKFRDSSGQVFGDSDSDAVVPYGVDLTRYSLNPIVLYQHDHEDIIGTASDVELRNDGIYATIKIYKSLNPKAYEGVRLGVLKTYSIGFRLKDLKYDEANDIFLLTSTEILEVSIVSIPANYLSIIDSIVDSQGNTLKGIKGTSADYLVKQMGTDEVNNDLMKTLKDLEAKIDSVLVKEEEIPEVIESVTDIVEVVTEPVVIPTISDLAGSAMVSAENFDELYVVQQTLTDKLNSFLQENL